MSFILRKGRAVVEYWPKKASTTITANSLLAFDTGTVTPASASTTRVGGIALVSVASTDSDFAANTRIPVLLPQEDNEFEADVTGTLTTAMVGEARDLSTALLVDAAGTSHNQVTITKFLSSSKAMVKINSAYSYENAV